ncbi:hypothetical protein [Streptomyces gardneri]|uniref:Lipoprotein n=1 Tax=Streptomyces gardneri TaxID=66892 RepID=A0A4Y3RN97_9ACTN|nr:hypothetical protein [Streptomyces gardneri]GEB57310.1 hypothetical protein SGA01_29150 [Streptomyces gardneri]GHH13159.1 hypothetical protein GCM10017674_60080 [Streptomyces gardneri]
MRSILLPKPLLTAALGSVVVLAALGTQSAHAATTQVTAPRASATTNAASAPSARASAVNAAVRVSARASAARTARAATVLTSARVAEARFLELANLIGQSCEPRVFSAVGHVTSEPTPDSTQPVLSDPVPLTTTEQCAAQRHQLRIRKAFAGKETATYEQMRAGLTGLEYPGARIHRMPNFAGKPVARLDLRVGAGRLALEVTYIGHGVMVEAFGAPQDFSVTDVRLKRHLDRPTS